MTAVPSRKFAVEVVKTLQDQGFQALWAGGCVRDQLMGRTPTDYDVATNATPDEIRELFGARRTIPVGAAFGVITVLAPKKSAGQIEVATFRTDASYSDGRRPDSVSFSTAQEDAQRRDFTINGLFYDPITDQVIDYVGGESDLQQHVLRAIGDPAARISEDKLRMLRAVRFAAAFEFDIESKTLQAIQQHASEIELVSAERVGVELHKMLGHPSRHLAYRWLRITGLFDEILPCPSANPDVVPLNRAPELCFATLRNLDVAADHCAALAGILLFFCDGDETVERLSRGLRWSNDEVKKTLWIYRHVNCLWQADLQPWSQIQPLLTHRFSPAALLLAEAMLQAGVFESDAGIQFCRRQLDLPAEQLDPRPFLDGVDLRKLSLPPGPAFGEILHRVRAAQLDGTIHSRDEALALARQLFGELSD